MEALTFQHYLENQRLLSYDASRKQLNSLASEAEQLTLTLEDYVLAVFDMTGELMRFSITSMATSGSLPGTNDSIGSGNHQVNGKPSPKRTVLQDLQELRHRLEIQDTGSDSYFSNDVDKKLKVTQASVEKVERALYGLVVRGSERPKGWMPDLQEGQRVAEVES